MRTKLFGLLCLCTVYWACVCQTGSAEEYPVRPIHMVVPSAAGGAVDVSVRRVADKVSRSLGQPVLVDNRPGAGGSIGANLAARAKPDGYTIFVGAINSLCLTPLLYQNLPYNPIRDFAPLTVPHIKARKLRAIAIVGDKRKPILPDTPTSAEAGLPGFEVTGWHGYLVPSGTAPAIVDRLNKEIAAALRSPDYSEWAVSMGSEIGGGTSEQFGALMRAELDRWGKIIRDSGVKLE